MDFSSLIDPTGILQLTNTPQASFGDERATAHIDRAFGQYLFTNGFRSDFIIKCQGREWKVHREILVDRSGYFKRLFGNAWRETSDGFVTMTDHPDIIQCLLEYIYTSSYSLPTRTTDEANHFCTFAGATNLKLMTAFPEATWVNLDETTSAMPSSSDDLVSLTAIFYTHLLVAAVGDRLEVMVNAGHSALEQLAHEQFRLLLPRLPQAAFSDVLRLVFDTIPTAAKGNLRAILTELCLYNSNIMDINNDIVALIEKHEWLAWEVGRKYRDQWVDADQEVTNLKKRKRKRRAY